MKDLKKTLYLGVGSGAKLLAGLFAVKICAQLLGPEAFGITGQLSSLLSVVSLLTGATVSVGLTKVYAGVEFPLKSRPDWIKAAWWIAMGAAGLLAALLLIFSEWLVEHLFSETGQAGYWLIGGLIAGTLPIAFGGIGQGKINGSHRDDLYALSLVFGSMVGLLGLWVLGHYLGSIGALLGMIWMVVAQALAMNLFGKRVDQLPLPDATAVGIAEFKSKTRLLLSYGALSIAAGAIIPIVYVTIRMLIQQHEGDRIFGLWQATLRISEAYSQLPLMLLSVVLFPRFAASASASLDRGQIRQTYLFVSGLMAGIAAFVYLARDYWIPIVFTAQFEPMESFVAWQLVGDTLRVLSYVGTTILAARGAVKLCIIGEFVQGGLLLVTSLLLIPELPLYGSFYAYIFTYGIYLPISIAALTIRRR